jgi:hypothetical protein
MLFGIHFVHSEQASEGLVASFYSSTLDDL